ncbi:MAG: amino acid decarboxylase, partial [Bacteroidota bacterium]
QASYLGKLVRQHPRLQLLAEVSLNIVCYRYNPGGLNEAQLDILNKELLIRLHEEGIALPSFTLLNGKYTIRVAITNHRSTRADFDLLVEASVRIADDLEKK